MQRDEFFWTSTINKATIVVNAAEGLLSKEAAREAAGGVVARLEAKAEKDPALRVKSYIAYEPLLIAETSPAVTLIHAGRSRSGHSLHPADGHSPRPHRAGCQSL